MFIQLNRTVKILLVAAMTMYVSACAKGAPPPKNSGGCEWVEPIVLTCEDIDVTSIDALRQIDTHNGNVNDICGTTIPPCRG